MGFAIAARCMRPWARSTSKWISVNRCINSRQLFGRQFRGEPMLHDPHVLNTALLRSSLPYHIQMPQLSLNFIHNSTLALHPLLLTLQMRLYCKVSSPPHTHLFCVSVVASSGSHSRIRIGQGRGGVEDHGRSACRVKGIGLPYYVVGERANPP